MSKSSEGRFFEDFNLGETIRHATPRTVHGGDLSLYIAVTGDRRALHSSTAFAKSLGYTREVVHDLLVFHIVFGKTVRDVSINAVANLGYAEVKFHEAVYPGDTLHAESEVIGLRETSSGKSGVVYVRTRGYDQRQRLVLSFCRWVLVNKRDHDTPTGHDTVPELTKVVAPEDLPVPKELNLDRFDDLQWATGDGAYFEDYVVGETLHHVDGMTIEEADHLLLTRLYQNSAKVHFNQHAMESSRFGKRLVYGGHVISVAHALAFNGLENALTMSAWNGGAHANPSFAGDTIYTYSEVLDAQTLQGHGDRLGALRLRMVAVKNRDPRVDAQPLKGDDGKYSKDVVLDLDYWTLLPRRAAAQ